MPNGRTPTAFIPGTRKPSGPRTIPLGNGGPSPTLIARARARIRDRATTASNRSAKLRASSVRPLSISIGGGGGPGPFSPFGPGSILPPAPATLGGGGGGGGGGGLTGAICGLLPANLQAICEAAGGAILGGGNGGGAGLAPQQCPEGTIRVGDQCLAPGDAFPGGDPFITEAGGNAVQGAFGLPAITPVREQRVHRNCPDGMVLGKDNLCYPKAILSRRSKFRKWRQPRRPLFTAGDLNAIRRAERLKGKAKKIGKDLGFKVTKR